MFESLSDKLHDVFRKLRGQSTLTETNITDAMREIRLALLDADSLARDLHKVYRAEPAPAEIPPAPLLHYSNDRLKTPHL